MTGGGPGRVLLPPGLRAGLGAVSVLAAVTVVVLGCLYAGDSGPGPADARILAVVDGVRPPWRHVADAIDLLGEPVGAVLLLAAVMTGLLLSHRPRAAVLVAAGPGLAVVTTRLLKPLVGRTIHGGNLAYPSGHTSFLTALALVSALIVVGRPGAGRTAGTLIVLGAGLAAGAAMGWAEVALGSHYPTDALGGCGTALAVVPAAAWLTDRTADSLRKKSR
ncbi:phosphatase PAP2 family protein [Streptomyces sp. NBC_01463]|uniref:phosphatase PAP2 family protein n=1 Tax=Streptomyces sp. NBC_01104 TaxID=2903750 RepID=UPI00325327AB|nr:phosphatase PAP2 family protein [Streptomyces sp. NBC_01104]